MHLHDHQLQLRPICCFYLHKKNQKVQHAAITAAACNTLIKLSNYCNLSYWPLTISRYFPGATAVPKLNSTAFSEGISANRRSQPGTTAAPKLNSTVSCAAVIAHDWLFTLLFSTKKWHSVLNRSFAELRRTQVG